MSLALGPLLELASARKAALEAVLRWKGITFDAQIAEGEDTELAMMRNKLARLILDAAKPEQVEECELEIDA